MIKTKRIGRFEIRSSTEGPSEFSIGQIYTDHANGEPRKYEIPGISLDEARDLLFGLQWMIRMAEEADSKRRK